MYIGISQGKLHAIEPLLGTEVNLAAVVHVPSVSGAGTLTRGWEASRILRRGSPQSLKYPASGTNQVKAGTNSSRMLKLSAFPNTCKGKESKVTMGILKKIQSLLHVWHMLGQFGTARSSVYNAIEIYRGGGVAREGHIQWGLLSLWRPWRKRLTETPGLISTELPGSSRRTRRPSLMLWGWTWA